jgi:hypothetical protein
MGSGKKMSASLAKFKGWLNPSLTSEIKTTVKPAA